MTRPFLAVLAASIALVGCANTLLSNDRIREGTSMALNLPASAITISNRRYDGETNTFYTATTSRGIYNCLINGGSVMAMGMTNPPRCTRQ